MSKTLAMIVTPIIVISMLLVAIQIGFFNTYNLGGAFPGQMRMYEKGEVEKIESNICHGYVVRFPTPRGLADVDVTGLCVGYLEQKIEQIVH